MTTMTERERPTTREAGRFYIDELAPIVNRKPDTIRKWERADMLPQHLKPKRGSRDWRYWTDNQVYGPRGILKWMKNNDIRPGAYLTSAEGEARHIAHMRRPRGIKITTLEEIKYWAKTFKSGNKKGKHRRSRDWILDHYLDQTTYSSKKNLERALVSYFAAQGWEFPPPAHSRRASSRMTKAQVKRHPEVRRLTRETNRIIKLVDKKLAKGKK
jgi:hypothetical protein